MARVAGREGCECEAIVSAPLTPFLGLDGIDADVNERATWSRRWRISRERRKKDLRVLKKLAVGEEARFGESYFQSRLCSLRNTNSSDEQ